MNEYVVKKVEVVDEVRKFDSTFFPGDGLYLWPSCNELLMVSAGVVSTLWCGVPDSVLASASKGGASGGVSESTLLKALAVAQNPELIREVL